MKKNKELNNSHVKAKIQYPNYFDCVLKNNKSRA